MKVKDTWPGGPGGHPPMGVGKLLTLKKPNCAIMIHGLPGGCGPNVDSEGASVDCSAILSLGGLATPFCGENATGGIVGACMLY